MLKAFDADADAGITPDVHARRGRRERERLDKKKDWGREGFAWRVQQAGRRWIVEGSG